MHGNDELRSLCSRRRRLSPGPLLPLPRSIHSFKRPIYPAVDVLRCANMQSLPVTPDTTPLRPLRSALALRRHSFSGAASIKELRELSGITRCAARVDDGDDTGLGDRLAVDADVRDKSPMLVEEEDKVALPSPVARNAPSPPSQLPPTLPIITGKINRRPPSPLHLLPQHSNYFPDAYPLQHHSLQHPLLPPPPPPGMIFYHPPSPLSPMFPPSPHIPEYVYYDPPFPLSAYSPDFSSSQTSFPPHYAFSVPISPEFNSLEGWGPPMSPMSNYSYGYSPTMTSPDPYGQFGGPPVSPDMYECWGGGGAWEGVQGREGEGVRRSRGITKWFDKQKGFGFILDDQRAELGGKDVFVHYTAILLKTGFRCLTQHEAVEYDVVQATGGGYQALNVCGARGRPLKGLKEWDERVGGERTREELDQALEIARVAGRVLSAHAAAGRGGKGLAPGPVTSNFANGQVTYDPAILAIGAGRHDGHRSHRRTDSTPRRAEDATFDIQPLVVRPIDASPRPTSVSLPSATDEQNENYVPSGISAAWRGIPLCPPSGKAGGGKTRGRKSRRTNSGVSTSSFKSTVVGDGW